MKDSTNDDHKFKDWLHDVDRHVTAKTGLGRDDLPDCPYADWYEEGVSPKRAAARALKRAGE